MIPIISAPLTNRRRRPPMGSRQVANRSQLKIGPRSRSRFTDLSIIGVPDRFQTNYPVPSAYPQRFSGEARHVWDKLVTDPQWKSLIKDTDVDLAWDQTIREFLSRCTDSGVLPFVNNTDMARNEFVREFLMRSRRHVVEYMNEIGMFKKIKIRHAYREYTRRENGLTVRCWAELYPLKDPDFESWLTKAPLPRFWKLTENMYVRIVRPHIKVWVKFVNRSRVVVGFEIQAAGSVTIPGSKSPSRRDVATYIDRTIMVPIIKSHRFKDLTTRLF